MSPMWLQSIFIPSEFCNLCAYQHRYRDGEPNVPPKYTIFVSFNEAQEEFVHELCKDLRRRGRSPRWFDKPSSFNLWGLLRHNDRCLALKECGMVVVVVSEEYLTSFRQQLELRAIIIASVQNKNLTILPLFFGLNFDGLCDGRYDPEWFKRWKWFPIFNINKWGMRMFLGSNVLVYKRGSSLEEHVANQKEIVSSICKVVPPAMTNSVELYFPECSKLCKVIPI